MEKSKVLLVVVLLLAVFSGLAEAITFKGVDWVVPWGSGSASINGSGNLVMTVPDATATTTTSQGVLRIDTNWAGWDAWRDSASYPASYGQWYEVTFKYDLGDMFQTRFQASGTPLDGTMGMYWDPIFGYGNKFQIKDDGVYSTHGTDLPGGGEHTLGVERKVDNTLNYYIDGALVLTSSASAMRMNIVDLNVLKRWYVADGVSVGGDIEVTDFQMGTGAIPEPATISLLSVGLIGLVRKKKRS